MPASRTEHPEWLRRLAVAQADSVPWVERHIPLAGRTVLEYGCGQGAIACAFAPRCGAPHRGGHRRAERSTWLAGTSGRGLQNVELFAWPAEEIQERLAEFRGEVDVLLLYAVLEHLTIDERLAMLRLGRELLADDGHIVISETPNRLTPIDHHTGNSRFCMRYPRRWPANLPALGASRLRRSNRCCGPSRGRSPRREHSPAGAPGCPFTNSNWSSGTWPPNGRVELRRRALSVPPGAVGGAATGGRAGGVAPGASAVLVPHLDRHHPHGETAALASSPRSPLAVAAPA